MAYSNCTSCNKGVIHARFKRTVIALDSDPAESGVFVIRCSGAEYVADTIRSRVYKAESLAKAVPRYQLHTCPMKRRTGKASFA